MSAFTVWRDLLWAIAMALLLVFIFFGLFCYVLHDDRYATFDRRPKGWFTLACGLLAVVLFAIGFRYPPVPFVSEYERIQQKVNACLEAGGTPIVTDAGTRSDTYPTYWGCKKEES